MSSRKPLHSIGQLYFAQSGETRALTSSSSKEDVDEVLDARDSRSHSVDDVMNRWRMKTRYWNRNEYPQRRLGQRDATSRTNDSGIQGRMYNGTSCRVVFQEKGSIGKANGGSLREISGKKGLPNRGKAQGRAMIAEVNKAAQADKLWFSRIYLLRLVKNV